MIYIFFVLQDYEYILVEESYYQCEIETLLATKSYVDDKLSKLKLTTKDPDSNNIKVIRSLTRKIIDLQESIDMMKMQLHETRLTQTELEAHYRASYSIINQHVRKEDEEGDLLLGSLAYVLMKD